MLKIFVICFFAFCLYFLFNCMIVLVMLRIMGFDRFREVMTNRKGGNRDYLFFAIGLPLLLYNKFEDRIKEKKRKRKVRKLKKKLRKLNDRLHDLRFPLDISEKVMFMRSRIRRNDTIRELDELMTEEEKERLENKVSVPSKVKRMI